MKKILTTILCLLASIFSFGQQFSTLNCPTIENSNDIPKSGGNCTQISNDPNDYFRRYEYYKDIYAEQNEVVIPIDIYIWQKDGGSGNFADNTFNRSVLEQSIVYLSDDFYGDINVATFQPIPNIVNYDSTKIRFELKHIYFEKNTNCWGKGGISQSTGEFLNHQANLLHSEGEHNFKIHITGANPSYSGFGTFPTDDFNHEHFIVTFNGSHSIQFSSGSAWPMAGHLAHEFGHNLGLHHTYTEHWQCDENDPDYLDVVFGSSQNGTKACLQDASWGCNLNDPQKSCTNNLMGGNKANGYIAPKQVQRMHRALSLLSIRKYAVAYHFDDNKFIEVNNDQTWDFSRKMYTNLKIDSGATLTIKCTVHFVPQAKVVIEPGGKLIIDGGTLTNEAYYNDYWQGIQVWGTSNKNQYPSIQPTYQGRLVLKNGGTIEYAHVAAQNWKPQDYSKTGGVINADGGIFRNNRRDVVFMSYQNTTPGLGNPTSDLSFFKETDFITNDNFIEGYARQDHVSLWDVHGIHFNGCNFLNNKSGKKWMSSAPSRAIYAIDAGFTVSASC